MSTLSYTEKFQDCLKGDRALPFLIDLAFDLTVAARGTYQAGLEGVERPRALRGLTEVSHRILSRASGMFEHSWQHSPAQFVELIFDIAGSYDSVEDLQVALDMSFARLRTQH